MTTSSQDVEFQAPTYAVGATSAPPLPPPMSPPYISPADAHGPLSSNHIPPGGETGASRRHGRGISGGRLRGAAVAAAAVAVVAVLLAAGVFKSGSTVTGIQARHTARADAEAQAGLRQPGRLSVSGAVPFVLHYPSDWTPLTARQLARIASPPAGGLLAEGGRVLLLVRPENPLTQPVATLSAQLTRSLSGRFSDFKLLSTGTTTTLAGPAWVYTFERTGQGLVQSEVVISTGRAAYEIDIAVRGGANRAAQEMGEIVHSFQT
jgi:hypothetical protein